MKSHKKEITEYVNKFLFLTGDISQFASIFFSKILSPPYEIAEIIKQMYIIGYKTLILVSITVFIIGLVITIQLTPKMEEFGAAQLVPNMLAVALIREVGPVLTALVCAGKVGSGIGAEVGSMKISEQIDAMAVTGVDPYKYLISTRVIATTLTLPILSVYSFAVGLTGAFIAYNLQKEMSVDLFLQVAFIDMNIYDVIPSVIKSHIFGFFIAVIGGYYGYHAKKGSNGVGQAANAAVVTSYYIIFFVDMVAAQVVHILTS